MGGWIGFGMAKYAPERVDALLVVGAHPYADRSWDAFRHIDGADPGAFLTALESVLEQRIPPELRPLVLANDLRALAAAAQERPALDAYLRATGKLREEIVGRPVFEVFPDNPDSPFEPEANSRASFERVLRHRLPDAQAMRQHDIRRPEQGGGFEGRFSKSSNTPVLDENSDVLYIIHHVEDVAEPVRAEQEPRAETSPVDAGGRETGAEARPDAARIRREADAAREREECYSAIFDKAPFGMALTKMPGRTLVAVNDAFLKLFECNREEVPGKNSGDLGIPDVWLRGRIASELRQRATWRSRTSPAPGPGSFCRSMSIG